MTAKQREPVVVIGAERFPAAYICRHFARLGHEVVAVSAGGNPPGDAMQLPWDRAKLGPWAMALEGAGAVVELADAGDGGAATRLIGRAIAGCRVPPQAWVHVGSISVYQEGVAEPADEWWGAEGEGESARRARDTEQAFFGCMVPGRVRKLALRVAPVLANDGRSPWDLLVRLAQLGIGARFGGDSRVSWLHLDDLLRALDWLLDDPRIDGWINVCAPNGARPGEVMRVVRELTGNRFGLPLPRRIWRFIGRCLGGPGATCIEPVWAKPSRLVGDGFSFRWPALAPAMRNLVGREGLEGFFSGLEWEKAAGSAWTAASPLVASAAGRGAGKPS